VSFYDAEQASCLWDHRRKRIAAGMAVTDVGPDGEALAVNLYTPEATVEVAKRGGGWRVERHPHAQRRPLMAALRHRPTLRRPLGKSRITRTVMSITDSAVRTALRIEVCAEFNTAPQKWIMGARDGLFEDGEYWSTYINSILAVTRDDRGDAPTVGQFPQVQLQPQLDYMRQLAGRMSGATSVPLSALGFTHDSNPTSAEAIYATEKELTVQAEDLNAANRSALRDVALMALAVAKGVGPDGLTPAELTLTPRFADPTMEDPAHKADAAAKMAAAVPALAQSQVGMELLGLSAEQIARVQADARRASAQQALAARGMTLKQGDA